MLGVQFIKQYNQLLALQAVSESKRVKVCSVSSFRAQAVKIQILSTYYELEVFIRSQVERKEMNKMNKMNKSARARENVINKRNATELHPSHEPQDAS